MNIENSHKIREQWEALARKSSDEWFERMNKDWAAEVVTIPVADRGTWLMAKLFAEGF